MINTAAVTVAVAAKKAAAILLTDKRSWKAIAAISGGVILIFVAPLLMMFSVFNSAQQMNYTNVSSFISTLPPDQQAVVLENIGALKAIESEIKKQKLDLNPIKPQVIYLYSLISKEKNNPAFYTDYIACFKDTVNDNQIFDNISSKFDVTFTEEKKQEIIAMYTMLIDKQTLPATGLHNEIYEMTQNNPTPPSEGDFLSPFRGGINYKEHITSPFGERLDPVTGKKKSHNGLDIGMPLGTSIYASKGGKVLFVRYDENGYGKYLAIDHGGGYVTLYGHCSEILVTAGQQVTFETVIAKVGSTGKSTGPHLHFEVIVKGKPENPNKYLP